jgi:anti-sigma factor RsiW
MRVVTWSPMRIFDALHPHARWYREVDAYVDSELSPRMLAGFEAHLHACRRCASAVDARASLKRAFGSMPQLVAPRSFRLSPDMVAGPMLPTPASQPSARLASRLSLTLAGLAVVGFASTLVVDLNRTGQGAAPMAAPSTFQVSPATGDSAARPVAGQAAPPQANTPQVFSATPVTNAASTAETGRPYVDSGQKAVAPAAPATSTGHRGPLRLIEIGFGVLAAASAATSLFLIRKQRRTSS